MHMTTINIDLFLSQLMNIFLDTCRFEICHLVKKVTRDTMCVHLQKVILAHLSTFKNYLSFELSHYFS